VPGRWPPSPKIADLAVCALTLLHRLNVAQVFEEFRRYWLAAGPFIRLMRPAAMRALGRQLHHGASRRPVP
jgi:hypothetical protein